MAFRKYQKFHKVKKCRFCQQKIDLIDYKDVATIQKYCNQQGKISSRKRTGCCAKHQRMITQAIKQSRFMALMPYIG
ncbi:MAG: 30S ribosomal protein S18 [Planctomycetes bacterium]|nr:30S ribosomal protein S18 [Planctomycetota bacterium]MCK5578596.1 30S ribosomal protein S18 [Planctomycetota bacterium]